MSSYHSSPLLFSNIPPVYQSPNDGGNSIDASTLPRWDLSHLYTGLNDPNIQRDIADIEKRVQKFKADYEGKIESLTDGDVLANALQDMEALSEIGGKIMSYAFLLYTVEMENSDVTQFLQNMQEKMTMINTETLFFGLSLNRIPDENYQAMLDTSERLQFYQYYLEGARLYRPHQLSDDLEKMLTEKALSGKSAWNRLFDETMTALRFPFVGDDDKQQDLTLTEISHFTSSPDETIRKQASLSMGSVLKDNSRLLTQITNTLAKDKEIETRWRGYERPVSSRNLSNRVEDPVVDALVDSVKTSYPHISHRYYALKAKWMGKDKLDSWNRNAPVPDADTRVIEWDMAVDTIINAYTQFDPTIGAIGKKFFDENWIDAPATKGKRGGAFAHPCVPSVHPYLMVNYQGTIRDVMTVAHELGHGIHQYLAREQGYLLANTPLTLAETASVFGEMLTFKALLAQTTDKPARRAMIASKIEDMINTVVRQISFYEFERMVHDGRAKGELSTEQLNEFWMISSRESLGDAVRYCDNYEYMWSYVPHFIHSPFYVYAYAFGDCLVNALYGVYEDQPNGFAEKYTALLSAGGSKGHKELLAPFGLDASNPDFWNKGLGVISALVDELETLLD